MKSVLLSSMVLALFVIGCEQQPPSESKAAGAKDGADAVPAGLVLATAPSGAKDVGAVKAAAKPGDDVVVRGRIAGRKEPIAANRAIITILDPAIRTCGETMPEDKSMAPWDACCEDPALVAANSATVQVVARDGRPLKAGLQGHKGIEPMREVIVIGKVRTADANNLVVDAAGIYVKS